MEEMQEALRGKVDSTRCSRASMLGVRGCNFSTDSLDDQALREEHRDSSTLISEFSSTKTLMNIDDDIKKTFDEITENSRSYFSSKTNVKKSFDDVDKVQAPVKTEKISIETTGAKKKVPNTLPNKKLIKKRSTQSKRDSSGNVVNKSSASPIKKSISPSPVRKTPSPLPTSRSPSPRKLSSGKTDVKIVTRSEKFERSCCRSSKSRTPPPQSPSPTRAKRARTLESREMSQSPSPTRKRQNVDVKKELNKLDLSERSRNKKKMKVVMEFDEFLPPSERSQSPSTSDSYGRSSERKHSPGYIQVPAPSFYLSPIEENSETSSTSSRSRREEIKCPQHVTLKEQPTVPEEKYESISEEDDYYYTSSTKYHTYPKSRIPVLRKTNEKKLKMMDPRMYPLEPREVDLEAFQQLHNANSQEELQEFLLLESQCSGTLGLGDISSHELYYHDDHSEDERGTMSGSFICKLIIMIRMIFVLVLLTNDA